MQGAVAVAKSRVGDYLLLAKPELTLLSVATAVCGAYLAGPEIGRYVTLLHVFLGTLLVGSGAGALNQFWERHYDAMMRRTENRPLPSGRVRPVEALVFGCSSAVLGLFELLWCTNALAAGLAIATLVTYILLYTPLKRLTPLATLVGGIPGALPPVIGWVAVRGTLGPEAVTLFALLFFWQMPHFLSLGWLYRIDYARAGYRLMTVGDQDGRRTARSIVFHSLAMVVASFAPVVVGLVHPVYALAAAAMGALFLVCSIGLAGTRSNLAARKVFAASLVYLPAIFTAMVVFRA